MHAASSVRIERGCGCGRDRRQLIDLQHGSTVIRHRSDLRGLYHGITSGTEFARRSSRNSSAVSAREWSGPQTCRCRTARSSVVLGRRSRCAAEHAALAYNVVGGARALARPAAPHVPAPARPASAASSGLRRSALCVPSYYPYHYYQSWVRLP